MNLYRCLDVDEETPVQFVGVHPLRWRPAWGEPTAMFYEATEEDLLHAAWELPEVQALVEAVREMFDVLDNVYRDDPAWTVTDWLEEEPTATAAFVAQRPFQETDFEYDTDQDMPGGPFP